LKHDSAQFAPKAAIPGFHLIINEDIDSFIIKKHKIPREYEIKRKTLNRKLLDLSSVFTNRFKFIYLLNQHLDIEMIIADL
jgi:hypothetical protein